MSGTGSSFKLSVNGKCERKREFLEIASCLSTQRSKRSEPLWRLKMTSITLLSALPGSTPLVRFSFALLSFPLVNNSFLTLKRFGTALQRSSVL